MDFESGSRFDGPARRDIVSDSSVEGRVTGQLPSGLYQVEIEGAHQVIAHAGSGPERNFVRVLVGDRVVIELASRDRTRGRIVRKA